jgi:hypothetical protein
MGKPEVFELVVKKFKFLKQLKLRHFATDVLVKLVIKYCKCLNEIEFALDVLSLETIVEFGQKCGEKLEKLKIRWRQDSQKNRQKEKFFDKDKTLIRLCPNLVSFTDNYLRLSPKLSLLTDDSIILPKLRSDFEDIEYIKTFVKLHNKKFKCLEFFENENETKIFFQQMAHLKSLQKINFCFRVGVKNFDINSLKLFGNECNRIKELRLELNLHNDFQVPEIFKCMQSFKQLNRLCLSIRIINAGNLAKDEISCETLKNFEQLTHLVIEDPETKNIFFENISKHLPNLKILDIRVANITNTAIYSVSKLPKLEKLCIRNYGTHLPFVTDIAIIEVINKCEQIQSIIFNVRPGITHKTIDSLIALTIRKPRIKFMHQFSKSGLEDLYHYLEHRVQYPNEHLKRHHLLQNLKIYLD